MHAVNKNNDVTQAQALHSKEVNNVHIISVNNGEEILSLDSNYQSYGKKLQGYR